MAKSLTEYFKKYEPTEKEAKYIHNSQIIAARADKEKRIIEVDVSFDYIVPKNILYKIEDDIASGHNINKAYIRPIYKSELFSESCMSDIIKESYRRDYVSEGFLDNCEFRLDKDTVYISISLNSCAVDILYASETDKKISDLIYSEYKRRFKIVFESKANSDFGYETFKTTQ